MPRGGARPGAGRPRKQAGPPDTTPRPAFTGARDFAVWCLNAPDGTVPLHLKIKACAALVRIEAREARQKKPPQPAEDGDWLEDWAGQKTEAGGIYTPRSVRGFGVVDGDCK